MKVYTYSEARRWFSRVLDEARQGGEIRIRRRDGAEFSLRPVSSVASPLDVPGVDSDVTREDLIGAIREGRDRHDELGSA